MRKILIIPQADGKTKLELKRVFKRLTFRVLLPESIVKVKPLVVKAGPGKAFTEENRDNILMEIADQVEARFKLWDFKCIPLSRNEFKFVAVGLKMHVTAPKVTPLGGAPEELATPKMENLETVLPAQDEKVDSASQPH